jgi:hypothetical protein
MVFNLFLQGDESNFKAVIAWASLDLVCYQSSQNGVESVEAELKVKRTG